MCWLLLTACLKYRQYQFIQCQANGHEDDGDHGHELNQNVYSRSRGVLHGVLSYLWLKLGHLTKISATTKKSSFSSAVTTSRLLGEVRAGFEAMISAAFTG